MSSTWASVVPAGTVPKDYPRHFDGLSGRPGASVSRRSPRSRAHRGPLAFLGAGRPGPAHRGQRRLELGANSYEVLVPRSPMGACIHAPWPWPRGDQKMRERQRQTATKPRYYIRGIEITAISGLGRFGSLGLLALPCAGARRPDFYPSASRPSISPISRRSARKRCHTTDGEALEAVGVVSLPTARPKVALLCAAVRRTRRPGPGPRSRPDTL